MNQLRICVGTSCHLNGANNIVATFQHLIEDRGLHDKVELSAMFCARSCTSRDVAVQFNDESYRVSPAEARAFFINTILPKL